MKPTEREEPVWIPLMVVMAAQYEQLNEHGGLHGIRDRNVLESALGRPKNRFAYEPAADLADLAAAYTFGLATAHPFSDGNKRIAYVTAAIFLDLNGLHLAHTDDEIVRTMFALAAGTMTEEELARWFRESLRPR